jgi:heterodisulfide reductase subunit B
MEIGFYPGCSLKGTSREYNESVLALAKAFGIEIKEIEDWNCCGATAAHSMDRKLSLALPARVLALAEKQGFHEIVVPCASCYNRLAVTQYKLSEDAGLRKDITDSIKMPCSGKVKILNVIQFLDSYIKDKIQKRTVHPFKYDVACYYGCLLVRPHQILQFDRTEDPQSMDELMRMVGANAIEWGYKTECCGAGLSVSRTDLVAKLSGNIVKDAEDRGAKAIIVACPMCHSNLDMRRPQIDEYLREKTTIPVLYITQAIGLAIGLSPEELGLKRHFVETSSIY